MLVLGLLLIILTIGLTAGAVYDGGDEATVEILGQSLSTTVAGVFFAGAVTMLLFLVGVWALMASMGRARRKRADRKDAKTRQKESVLALEEERAALRAENERLSERLATTGFLQRDDRVPARPVPRQRAGPVPRVRPPRPATATATVTPTTRVTTTPVTTSPAVALAA